MGSVGDIRHRVFFGQTCGSFGCGSAKLVRDSYTLTPESDTPSNITSDPATPATKHCNQFERVRLHPLILTQAGSRYIELHSPKMSTLEDLDDMERDGKKDEQGQKDQDGDGDGKRGEQNGDADMKDADGGKKEEEKKEEEEDLIDMEILNSSTRDIIARRRLIENDTRIMKSEFNRLNHEKQSMHDKIKDNVDKIDNNR